MGFDISNRQVIQYRVYKIHMDVQKEVLKIVSRIDIKSIRNYHKLQGVQVYHFFSRETVLTFIMTQTIAGRVKNSIHAHKLCIVLENKLLIQKLSHHSFFSLEISVKTFIMDSRTFSASSGTSSLVKFFVATGGSTSIM